MVERRAEKEHLSPKFYQTTLEENNSLNFLMGVSDHSIVLHAFLYIKSDFLHHDTIDITIKDMNCLIFNCGS